MRNGVHSPHIWTIVEYFYRSFAVFRRQHDAYEAKVAEYVEHYGVPRNKIRLQQEELSALLNFKELELLRDAYLLPLKEACHALFRGHDTTDFMDRVVNDVFHEISILKEEHYNVLTYTSHGDGLALEEMQAILDEVHELFPIKVHRLSHLFDTARGRLEAILPSHRDNVILCRSIFLHRDGFVAKAYEKGLLHFYAILHGEDRIFEGFQVVGDSFYHSGFYEQAAQCFAAGEGYLQSVAPAAKRRLHSGWKEAREHFKRYSRNCRDRIASQKEE